MNKQILYRFWHTLRLYTIVDSYKRADYIKKHQLFHSIGNNCTIMDRKVPLYSKLISIGNNVHIASKVLFVTHDAIHIMLNNISNINRKVGLKSMIREKVGCISIGDNVFVGSNVTILYDVKIGSNVIIAAGSVVVNDIPNNSIVAGVPAKIINSFDNFYINRIAEFSYSEKYEPSTDFKSKEFETWCWNEFTHHHEKAKIGS